MNHPLFQQGGTWKIAKLLFGKGVVGAFSCLHGVLKPFLVEVVPPLPAILINKRSAQSLDSSTVTCALVAPGFGHL